MRRVLVGLPIVCAMLLAATVSAAANPCALSNTTGAGRPATTIIVPAPVADRGDSSTEINDAIQSAGGRPAAVQLQSSVYYISHPITVGSNIDLRGGGRAHTRIQATTALGGHSLVQTQGARNVTIEAMTLNQDGSRQTTRSLTDYLLDLNGWDGTASNVFVKNVATRNPSTYAIVAENELSRFCIFHSDVRDTNLAGNFNQLDGIHIIHSSDGDIVDNYVDNMAGGAPSGDDGIAIQAQNCGDTCWNTGSDSNINVSGNVVRGGVNGGEFDFAISSGESISGITISGNEFWGSPDQGLRAQDFGGAGTLSNVNITDNFDHNHTGGGHGYVLPYSPTITQSNITVDGWQWCNDQGGAPKPSSGTSNGVTATNVIQYTTCTNSPTTTTHRPARDRAAPRGAADQAPAETAEFGSFHDGLEPATSRVGSAGPDLIGMLRNAHRSGRFSECPGMCTGGR